MKVAIVKIEDDNNDVMNKTNRNMIWVDLDLAQLLIDGMYIRKTERGICEEEGCLNMDRIWGIP